MVSCSLTSLGPSSFLRLQMGRLLLLIVLIALSAAVPTKTADAVVPESKFDHRVAFSQMSPTDFIQAMSKAGNTEG